MLIIGAGPEQLPAYEQALKMGLQVVGSDMNPQAPAFALPVDRIIASTYDPDETLAAARAYHQERPIDGVMTLACDAPLTVARVAGALGLPGISEESALLGTDKHAQIVKFQADGVPVPAFALIDGMEQALARARAWGYPVILKPTVGRGGRGVLRITDEQQLVAAFAGTGEGGLAESGAGPLLIQQYLHGPQISSETIIVEGVAYTAMLAGRNYEHLDTYAPHVIENGGWLPAALEPGQQQELEAVIQQVADSYGIRNGYIKGDLVLTPEGVKVIEFAARMGGGYAVSHSIPATCGINLVEQSIRLALGRPIATQELVPHYHSAAAIRFWLPGPGVVKEIRGFDELDHLEGLLLKKMYIEVGEIIEPMTNHTRRAGCVIVTGRDLAEAEARVRRAIAAVQIITEPV